MSSLQQIFPFNNTLVRRFLNWKQGDEEDTWRNKAIEALCKKLKRPPNEQFSTLQTVLHQKSENTPCITLSRSQDGRLQVSHRKMLPHVMYCRIFRWPDLQSQHELRSLPSCDYPFQRREHNKICVNPYHYARVDHSLYPPVVTPRPSEATASARNTEFTNASPPPQSPMSPGSTYSQQGQQSSPIYFGNNTSNLQLSPVPQPAHYQSYQSPHLQQENPNDSFNYFRASQPQINLNNQQQPIPMNSNFYAASQSPLSESNWSYTTGNNGPNNRDGMVPIVDSPRSSSQFESQSPPPGYSCRNHQQLNLMPMDATMEETQQTGGSATDEGHWCKITYYELSVKVGEPFQGSSPKVIVDGFTDPSVHNRRFSLGVLSNINRNSTIEMTRRAIRKGVCLENNDAQIYVQNLSDSSIFFHSKNCNVENQLNQYTVVKIEPQGRQKIFDQKVFENLVHEAFRSQDGRTYEGLYSLTEHCLIKMSFVKGWGSIYHRQDVTSTPCWIEIHLLKPYALIDQYLRQVGPPATQVTSTS